MIETGVAPIGRMNWKSVSMALVLIMNTINKVIIAGAAIEHVGGDGTSKAAPD